MKLFDPFTEEPDRVMHGTGQTDLSASKARVPTTTLSRGRFHTPKSTRVVQRTDRKIRDSATSAASRGERPAAVKSGVPLKANPHCCS